MIYRPPLHDYRFLLADVLELEAENLPDDLPVDDMIAVLEEAARFAARYVQPFNIAMSEAGCRMEDGRVHVPPALREAFLAYAEGGWIGLTASPDHGGQGLPQLLSLGVADILNASSIAFADYVGLIQFGYLLMAAHGDESLKRRYLCDLANGHIGAAMCITEPHCGSDVGLLTSRAEPLPDGRYALRGTKIFVSAGDQDLTSNILYFVLARLPGAAPGPAGISLFCVPRITDQGANAVTPVSLEKKMGYAASATCQLSFDGAAGWQMGEPGRGLNAMFVMISNARIATAAQGIGAAEIAYQNAAAYALARLQGRSPARRHRSDGAADPIVAHPDVRRLLIGARAYVEGARAAYLWAGRQMDIARRHPSEEQRRRAAALLALTTGPMKAVFSDLGFQACNDCMQVFGGHGYIRETGMEQLVRDVRLSQIQEGANGMLAYDLLHRHLATDRSGAYRDLVDRMRATASRPVDDVRVAGFLHRFSDMVDDLERTVAETLAAGSADPEAIAAAAHDCQRIFGLTLLGWFWARMAIAAASRTDRFGRDKLITARFFFDRMAPMADGHIAVIRAGGGSITETDDSYFGGQAEPAAVS